MQTEQVKDVEIKMSEWRNKANKVTPEPECKLYLQKVGKYTYLRWRRKGSVISTRCMKELSSEQPSELPEPLKLHIDTYNPEAELLNLQYSMLLKIQQMNKS